MDEVEEFFNAVRTDDPMKRRAVDPLKRIVGRIAIVLAVVGLLALASFLTTRGCGLGGFVSGEFRLNILDLDGQPVKGAILRVYRKDTQSLEYFFENNHVSGKMFVSGEDGRITTAIGLRRYSDFRCWWMAVVLGNHNN